MLCLPPLAPSGRGVGGERRYATDARDESPLTPSPSPRRGEGNINWRYEPCAALAGDWLDESKLVVYVLDVTGHGLASALLSVSVMNVIRSQSLPGVDFSVPGQVLAGLNEAFDMEKHGDKCFTIWYGVYDANQRKLSWAGGGHPPALLFDSRSDDPLKACPLESDCPIIGMMPWTDWPTAQREIASGSRLLLYTDGAHEIHLADGGEWAFAEFVRFMSQPAEPGRSIMDRLFEHVKMLKGSDTLDDDFSVVEKVF